MSDNLKKEIWLIGAGGMAIEYTKVLSSMGIIPIVIGRGQASAQAFTKTTGIEVFCGGINAFLETKPKKPFAVIVAVNVVDLAKTTARILNYAHPKILLEKPGAITSDEIKMLQACEGSEHIKIAYNRRFFASTQRVQKLLEEDGGPVSCTFEFTEWGHRIADVIDQKDPKEMKHWLIANSSHVIDLAFYLAGIPRKLDASVFGSLPWHPSGSIFCGSGITQKDVSFSYHANWEAPGRWWVEIMSSERRFKLCPLESVQVQKKGTIVWDDLILNDQKDAEFKPGLYDMVNTFISEKEEASKLCSFNEFIQHFPLLQQIAGYKD